MKLLRVKGWNELFESAKSREYNHRSQSYTPNKHGLGYRRILANESGEAIFGCWMALIQVLSRQERPRHGYLTDTGRSDGRPHTPDDIALLTDYSAATCGKMLELCSSVGVGWLEVVTVEDTTRIPQSPGEDARSHYPSPSPSPLPSPVEGSSCAPPLLRLDDSATDPEIIAYLQASHAAYKRAQHAHIVAVLQKHRGEDRRKIVAAVKDLMIHYAGDADLGMTATRRLDTYLQGRRNGARGGVQEDADARRREIRNATGYSISAAMRAEEQLP